jgi:hypothetical protein
MFCFIFASIKLSCGVLLYPNRARDEGALESIQSKSFIEDLLMLE